MREGRTHARRPAPKVGAEGPPCVIMGQRADASLCVVVWAPAPETGCTDKGNGGPLAQGGGEGEGSAPRGEI